MGNKPKSLIFLFFIYCIFIVRKYYLFLRKKYSSNIYFLKLCTIQVQVKLCTITVYLILNTKKEKKSHKFVFDSLTIKKFSTKLLSFILLPTILTIFPSWLFTYTFLYRHWSTINKFQPLRTVVIVFFVWFTLNLYFLSSILKCVKMCLRTLRICRNVFWTINYIAAKTS